MHNSIFLSCLKVDGDEGMAARSKTSEIQTRACRVLQALVSKCCCFAFPSVKNCS